MKKMIKQLQENARPIIQLILLICITISSLFFDHTAIIKMCFKQVSVDFSNLKFYILLELGNHVIGIVIALFILFKFIRSSNKEKAFNTLNVYHDYLYWWYWICSKILNYTKCNLKLVPIYLQFKLILEDTFSEFILGNDEEYPVKQNETIDIKLQNFDAITAEINLVLADTYPISENQIPRDKKQLSTIFISRDNLNDYNRYFSPEFVKAIVNQVRRLPRNIIINVYATTNPKHTFQIAKQAFNLADRGNVIELNVFQQNSSGIRRFSSKGKRIYKQ